MAPMHSHGLCPSCGIDVPRQVSVRAGVTQEIYDCPTDGRRVYGAGGVTLQEWVEPTPSMSTLHTMASMGPQIDWISA